MGYFERIRINKSDFSKPLQKPKSGPKYGDILYDRSKVFHGVGFDVLRLKSILEKGILSEQYAKILGVDIKRNNRGYNLGDSISVAESPAINNAFTSGCFGIYIKSGISFIIANEHACKALEGSERDSGYLDEAFIKGGVKRENIVGVMVPEDLLDKSLSELPLLSKIAYVYINERCNNIIEKLEAETGYHASTSQLKKLMKKMQGSGKNTYYTLEKGKQIKDLVDQMERLIGQIVGLSFSKKLGKNNPTLRDALKVYLPKSMKAYNIKGFEILL